MNYAMIRGYFSAATRTLKGMIATVGTDDIPTLVENFQYAAVIIQQADALNMAVIAMKRDDPDFAAAFSANEVAQEARAAAWELQGKINDRLRKAGKEGNEALEDLLELQKKLGDGGTIIEDFGPMSGGKVPER